MSPCSMYYHQGSPLVQAQSNCSKQRYSRECRRREALARWACDLQVTLATWSRFDNCSIEYSVFWKTLVLISSCQRIHHKPVSTQSIAPESAHERLAAQRQNRPVAPAMTIYRWEYVSSVSALQRITGLLLSGSLYGFATLYLLTPVTGIHLDINTIAAAFGSLPLFVKTGVKFALSMPFTYHGFNGIKHLVWDTGRLLGKTTSGQASWVVLVCSLSTSLALALMQL